MHRVNRVSFRSNHFANGKKKRPRVLEPEGVRLPREIGVTDLPCVRRSVDVACFVAIPRRQRERAQAMAGWPQRVTLCNVEVGFHDEAMIEKRSQGAKAAHVTPANE